jgi:hypothetical protein
MRPICDRPGLPVQHDDKFFFLFVGVGESDIAISKKSLSEGGRRGKSRKGSSVIFCNIPYLSVLAASQHPL